MSGNNQTSAECKKIQDDFEKNNPKAAQAVKAIETKHHISLESKESIAKGFADIKSKNPQDIMPLMMDFQKLQTEFPEYKKLTESKEAAKCLEESGGKTPNFTPQLPNGASNSPKGASHSR
jgi:hypothetical protein